MRTLYYTERLMPFLLTYLGYEAMEAGLLAAMGTGGQGDAATLLLGLANETAISFIFCIMPYLLYLFILPRSFHGGNKDKLATTAFFSLFCLVNALEELAEVLSGDSFHLLTATLLCHPSHILDARSLPGIGPGLFFALLLAGASIFAFRKKLTSHAPIPGPWQRLLFPFALATLAFILMQAQKGGLLPGNAPELYRDGLLSLFGGIFAFTAVPHLGQIYAKPCLEIALALLLLTLAHAAVSLYISKQASPFFLLQRGWQRLCARYGSFKTQLFCLLGAALLVRLCSLGSYPLMDTTEARYGEMARKMIETGNWLQPQFDYGIPFWGKPPLSFQACALAMHIGGVNAFAARLAPFLASAGIGILFYAWPFAKQRREQATAAFIIFITSVIGFVAAGAVMTDAFLALGTTLSMVSFWKAAHAPAPSRAWGYLFFIGLSIGLLSKGPLALALCGLPLFLWALRFRNRHELRLRLPWLSGTALMLALSVPWYLAAEHATPGFLRYFLVGEHFERFVTKGWQGDLYGSGHARPLGAIWLYAAEMFLPWTLLVPFLWRRRQPRGNGIGEPRLYLWLWGLSPLLFFTLARNILPAYVLPGIPAFCLLLTDTLWKRNAAQPGTKQLIFLPLPMLMLAALFAMGSGFSHIEYRCDQGLLRAWDGVSPLCYTDKRATYSGQFYSAGKARPLPPGASPGTLPPGAFLAAPQGSREEAALLASPDWEEVSHGYKRKLYRKREALREAPAR